MRMIAFSFACAHQRRPSNSDELVLWAKATVANPASHHATEREADIIAALLAELVIR
jgi:hypothetical protein